MLFKLLASREETPEHRPQESGDRDVRAAAHPDEDGVRRDPSGNIIASRRRTDSEGSNTSGGSQESGTIGVGHALSAGPNGVQEEALAIFHELALRMLLTHAECIKPDCVTTLGKTKVPVEEKFDEALAKALVPKDDEFEQFFGETEMVKEEFSYFNALTLCYRSRFSFQTNGCDSLNFSDGEGTRKVVKSKPVHDSKAVRTSDAPPSPSTRKARITKRLEAFMMGTPKSELEDLAQALAINPSAADSLTET